MCKVVNSPIFVTIKHNTMHLPIGTLLRGGRYEILRYISSGGFGCTYEARNTAFRNKVKTVAIKEFFVKDFCNRDASSNEIVVGTSSKAGLVDKLRNKFIEEAEALYGMNHPNVVRVTDFFEENSTAYYVMDYIDGAPLSSLIERQGRLSESESLGYIRQVAEALDYIHSQNRLHLDVKPQNIMIDGNGKAILIDFGVSKQYDEANGENTSTLLGSTPGYAPIEQSGHTLVKFNAATDIYSLGATLYKSLTGTTPVEAVLRASDENLNIVHLPTSVSKHVRHAINQAMLINWGSRPQSIAEFLSLLNSVNKSVENKGENDIKPSSQGETILSSSQDETVLSSSNMASNDLNSLMSAAEKGDVNAQHKIAVCYEKGKGVPQSYKKAAEWYRLAAEQGHVVAQYSFAVCFENGRGVPRSYKKAAEWYRLAAEQGHVVAQYNLAVCFDKGKGVPQSYEKAVEWYRLAADVGYKRAQNRIGELYAKGYGVSQSYEEAVRWYSVAANNGDSDAKYNLGVCYENGYGVPIDHDEAYKWYCLADEHEDAINARERVRPQNSNYGCVWLLVLAVGGICLI